MAACLRSQHGRHSEFQIRLADQPFKDAKTGVGGVVERHAFLVAVDGQEPQRFPVKKWWPPAARIVTTIWPLDLDGARAGVRQKHGRVGPGYRRRQVKNDDALEVIDSSLTIRKDAMKAIHRTGS